MHTTTHLLDGLADPAHEEAWRALDERYRPILIGFARRLGLADADAADVAQEALLRFLQEFRGGRYERGRGHIRSFLVTLARTRAADLRRRRARRREARGDSAFVELAADEADSLWEEECRHVILRQALDELRSSTRMQERTIRAFERVALEGQEPAVVAEELGMSMDEVYVAKHRTLERLRETIARITAAYHADE